MPENINLPPHNIEAEKWVISWALLDSEVMWIYDSDKLGYKDFYQKEHSYIYEAIQQLRMARKTIDVVTVSDQLSKNWNLDVIGGVDYLYDLSSFLFSTQPCSEYSKIVREKSLLRQVLKVCQWISGEVYEQKDTLQIFDAIEKKIFDLTQNQVGESIIAIWDILEKRVMEYIEYADNPEKLNESKVFSGYEGIDKMLTWFKPGELIILAARPSMGKTAFALNVLNNVALKQQKTVVFISLEMSSESIVDRILSEVAGVPMYKLNGSEQMNEEDFSKIWEANSTLWVAKIFIDDRGALTVPELKSKLRKLKIEKGWLDIVIIDYLQLMHGTSYAGNRVQEISDISRSLKELARELEVPIMALSQLSRAVEQRVDKKPQLSDLRESGAIEQDADAVLMLHREDYYDPDTENKWATDVSIRKNRNGAVGEVELHFQKEIMRFTEKPEAVRDASY